jgi:hypothetical protein
LNIDCLTTLSTAYTVAKDLQHKDLQEDLEQISNDIGDLVTPDPGKMGKNPKSKQTEHFRSLTYLFVTKLFEF